MLDIRNVPRVYVGCAGWGLPRAEQHHFPSNGTHLARYAARLPAVEINSSFYRPHRPATYARWAARVPASFRFSVKVPKAITHGHRLVGAQPLLDAFLSEVASLGSRLGCLLVQLPPSLDFVAPAAEAFFTALRGRYAGAIAAEPRHPTWFAPAADRLLATLRVARVAADPPHAPTGAEPGGWPEIVYYRLHGSPRVYYSTYDAAYLDALGRSGVPVWCIFDNTALGAATANALDMVRKLDTSDSERPALRE